MMTSVIVVGVGGGVPSIMVRDGRVVVSGDLLQVVLETVPVPLLLVDRDGRVARVNRALERFCLRPAVELVGAPGLEVAAWLAERFADPERFVRAVRAGFADAESVQEERFELRGGGWVRRWSLPLRDGGYAGRLVAFADVSAGVAGEARAAQLSLELVRAQERERARLASELHDGPVQVLAASLMRLDRLEQAGGPGDLPTLVDALRTDLRAAYAELRSLLFNLRPETLTSAGLGAAVRQLLAQLGAQTGVATELEDRLPAREAGERALVAFRVLQEALANVRKHAEASSVRVMLTRGGDAELAVELVDDGRGFDPAQAQAAPEFGHIGLLTMQERVELAHGRFELVSRPNGGTRIAFALPPLGG